MLRTSFQRLARWSAACLAVSLAGCIVDVDPGDDNGDGGGGGSPDTIRVNVLNQTGVTLDPEIFRSASPVSVDELFSSGNKFTAYGVGTIGLLGPGGSDSFTLTCEEARVIGTNGGKFGDNQNAPDGNGQRIVLTQDLSVFCGGTLTIVYSRRLSGEFETNHTVTR